jgi:hypothetical protein
MADLTNVNLDPDVAESTGGFTLVPQGKYKAVIVGDELADTKSGGKMLVLRCQIIEGQFQGEEVKARLNILNKSAQAQAIGQGQLRRICAICGAMYPLQNTAPLIGKPMLITIKHEPFKSNTTGEELMSMTVSAFAPVPKAQGIPASPPQAVGGATRSW